MGKKNSTKTSDQTNKNRDGQVTTCSTTRRTNQSLIYIVINNPISEHINNNS